VSASAATLHTPTANGAIAAPAIIVNSSNHTILGYNSSATNVALTGVATTTAGFANPTQITTVQPYIVLNYIICLQGIFPSRN
jgi:microcystin-dependent protein